MGTTGDRIRCAILFEIIGLLVVTPLGALAFEKQLHDIGAVALVSATLATLWNYLYNLGFDRLMLRFRGDVRKTPPIRVVHAVAFEAGLLIVLMPFVAWYLGIGLVEAFMIDLSFAGFYLVYAFVFNWLYDVVFPVPVPDGAGPWA